MTKRRLSHLTLLKELRKLLIRPDTKIIKRKSRTLHGKSVWRWDFDENKRLYVENILVYVDPRRDNHLSVIIHELLHVYMQILFQIGTKMTDEIEEAVILGLEKELYRFMMKPKNEKLLESWHKAVERKLSC